MNELRHYGVPGMKWGVRKNKNTFSKTLSKVRKNVTSYVKKNTKKASKLSDTELRSRIQRLRMEREFNDLLRSRKKVSVGKKILDNTIDRVGNDIAQQFARYWLGTAINKTFDRNIINIGTNKNKKKNKDDEDDD